MKSASTWFAELQDPPEEGLVDQPMRVITPEQIAAIQADALNHAEQTCFGLRAAGVMHMEYFEGVRGCEMAIHAEADKLRPPPNNDPKSVPNPEYVSAPNAYATQPQTEFPEPEDGAVRFSVWMFDCGPLKVKLTYSRERKSWKMVLAD